MVLFLVSHLNNWHESKQELKKAPVLSGMATFPMAGMILSTYVFSRLPSSSFGSARALVVFISLGFGLDCWFHHQVCLSGSEGFMQLLAGRFSMWG